MIDNELRNFVIEILFNNILGDDDIKGKWITEYKCSECGYSSKIRWGICPNCGAEMED